MDTVAYKLEGLRIKYATVDGKRIGYTDETVFWVQVGKDKGSYKTKYSSTNLAQAILLYKGVNICAPYKKRLLMPSDSRNPVIAKMKGN